MFFRVQCRVYIPRRHSYSRASLVDAKNYTRVCFCALQNRRNHDYSNFECAELLATYSRNPAIAAAAAAATATTAAAAASAAASGNAAANGAKQEAAIGV